VTCVTSLYLSPPLAELLLLITLVWKISNPPFKRQAKIESDPFLHACNSQETDAFSHFFDLACAHRMNWYGYCLII